MSIALAACVECLPFDLDARAYRFFKLSVGPAHQRLGMSHIWKIADADDGWFLLGVDCGDGH
jgi:hypothetical protein